MRKKNEQLQKNKLNYVNNNYDCLIWFIKEDICLPYNE